MPSRSVVLDTNVLFSAALKESSKPARILAQALQGGIVPITCPSIVEEYREVFARPKFRKWRFPPLWLEELLRVAIHVPSDPPLFSPEGFPDRDDIVCLALAAQQSACLITGNLEDFSETLRGRVEAVSASRFLDWLDDVGGN